MLLRARFDRAVLRFLDRAAHRARIDLGRKTMVPPKGVVPNDAEKWHRRISHTDRGKAIDALEAEVRRRDEHYGLDNWSMDEVVDFVIRHLAIHVLKD